MPKGGVKVKAINNKNGKKDAEELQKMFDQMTGAQTADRDVIIPKITNLKTNINKYCKLLSLILETDLPKVFAAYPDWFQGIATFLEKLRECYESFPEVAALDEMDTIVMNDEYKELKNNEAIKKVIITCGRLKTYHSYFEDQKNIDGSFINRIVGDSFEPFAFSSLDLKVIWVAKNQQLNEFILNVIGHIYRIGIEVYEITTSPDVDIKQFSTVLIDSIGKMKKQIPRCDKAFLIIENSVNLLESNFKTYYRQSVQAGDPSMIVQNFLVDVSMTQNASPSIMAQFKKIFYELNKRSSQSNDPNVKKLLKMLNSQFSMMEKEVAKESGEVNESSEMTEDNELNNELGNETDNTEPMAPDDILDLFSSIGNEINPDGMDNIIDFVEDIKDIESDRD